MNRRDITNAKLRHVPVLLMLLFCLYTASYGITLEAYRSKIDSARSAAIDAENSMRESGDDSSKPTAFIAQIRKEFPASERVDWQGGSVETSNDWLLERTKSLDSETGPQKRLQLVVEMREYLSAISFKLQELENPTSASRTKDEDKQKLAEILRREEYQKPQQKEESVFQRWLRWFLEWLESIFPKPTGQASTFSGMPILAFMLQILLYAALLALLGFLVYKIAPLLFPKLRRNRTTKKKDRVILGEQIGENETALDLFGEAERLAREGNLRGAIRKGYIALLCDLSDRKVIGLARNKTNRDYLRDVRSRRELHPRMKAATDTFERHWYGFQESGEPDWMLFREQYQEAIRSV